MRQGIIHVCPSISPGDSFPNVILDAKQAGLPSIVLPTAGLPEAVVDGIEGIVTADHSSEALAEAVVALLEDEPRRVAMGEAARSSLTRHDATALTDTWVQLFSSPDAPLMSPLPPRLRPNLIGIGAAKSGTTFLAGVLGRHPDIFMPPQKKELNALYYNDLDDRLDEYMEHFREAGEAKVRCDYSVRYLSEPNAPYRRGAARPRRKNRRRSARSSRPSAVALLAPSAAELRPVQSGDTSSRCFWRPRALSKAAIRPGAVCPKSLPVVRAVFLSRSRSSCRLR